jgi:hypothetical protein
LPPLTAPDEVRGAGTSCFPSAFSLQPSAWSGTLSFANLYRKVKEQGLIAGVCRACATKTGAREAAEAQGLELLGEMSGHPGVAAYLE